jgi:enoyl-[acyl-carrier protein] reductase/trans-2-enoyl-CoA reductase (NAD+)
VIGRIRELFGQVDLVVYSVASPVRKDPDTGMVYKSVIKPVGNTFTAKTVDFLKGTVGVASIAPAEGDDVFNTVKVMGGEDWTLWIRALMDAGVLADGVKTAAYSYIGPEVTKTVYRAGTIGAAKEHLEKTAGELDVLLKAIGGEAFVSVNKALVTRASSVIPVVPLYISLLFKIMKEKGIHEGCIEQMYRMLTTRVYGPEGTVRDEGGLVRMDDWEMREDVQAEVSAKWDLVDNGNLVELTDVQGYRSDFLQLHGFYWEGVNYSAPVHMDD